MKATLKGFIICLGILLLALVAIVILSYIFPESLKQYNDHILLAFVLPLLLIIIASAAILLNKFKTFQKQMLISRQDIINNVLKSNVVIDFKYQLPLKILSDPAISYGLANAFIQNNTITGNFENIPFAVSNITTTTYRSSNETKSSIFTGTYLLLMGDLKFASILNNTFVYSSSFWNEVKNKTFQFKVNNVILKEKYSIDNLYTVLGSEDTQLYIDNKLKKSFTNLIQAFNEGISIYFYNNGYIGVALKKIELFSPQNFLNYNSYDEKIVKDSKLLMKLLTELKLFYNTYN